MELQGRVVMAKGKDTSRHPSRQVHRDRFNATFAGPQGFGGVDPEYESLGYDEPRHPAEEEAERLHEAEDWRY
jgi:hypothetical protein